MRMEEMDFQRSKGQMIFMLVMVLVIFMTGPGTLFYFFISDITDGDPTTPMDSTTGLLALFFVLIAFAILMFYAVLNPWRFSYSDEGIHVITWRGPQFFPWNEVKKAALLPSRSSYSLMLNYGRLRSIYPPLHSYKKGRTLLNEISRRVPVKVTGDASLFSKVEDH